MKKLCIYGAIILTVLLIIAVGMAMYVKLSVDKNNDVVDKGYAPKLEGNDCIIILGAGRWGDKPSPMLEDRLLAGIDLYKNKVAKKIIMSGDHGKADYDEVNLMKDYAIKKGVASEDIFMDHAGFSTYDTIYRAKYIFKAKKIVLVSQRYHLYRAVYAAKKFGMEAKGVYADRPEGYRGATARQLREVLAVDKDFVKCLYKPKSKCLGDEISLDGSGDVTNDKK